MKFVAPANMTVEGNLNEVLRKNIPALSKIIPRITNTRLPSVPSGRTIDP